MIIQAQHLPNELWISIFSYLEVHDLFKAFNNLNHRFNQLLASDYLTFYVQLKKPKNRYLPYTTTPRWFNGILKRVVCLQSITQNGCGYVPAYLHTNAHKFTQLQSLTITTNTHQKNIICQILQILPSLEYLSITCKVTLIIMKNILAISTLRVCQLKIKEPLIIFDYRLNAKSNIEALYINFPSLSDYRFTNLLLANMPKLKRFEISDHKYSFWNPNKLFSQSVLNLQQLQTINFKVGPGILSSICFEHLQMISPALRKLRMDIFYLIIDEDLFNNLIYYWWKILEKLEKFYICVQGTYFTDTASIEMNNYRRILLAKNNEVNNCFKIKWTEYSRTLHARLIIEKNIKNN